MEQKYYLPWRLTAKLAIMGYNEPSNRMWEKPRSLIKPWKERLRNGTGWDVHNFYYRSTEVDLINEQREVLTEMLALGKEKGYDPMQFAYASNKCRLTAVTWTQAKEWFRTHYDVDFFERPHIGRTKEYVCDPLGRDFGTVRLQARATPLEALEQCIEFLCSKLEPLPIEEVKEEQESET